MDSFTVGPVVTRADIPRLCADLAGLSRRAGKVVVCDVAGVVRPGLVTVEALARLRLTARRHGRSLLIVGAGAELRRIMALAGLHDLLLQVGRQSEEREQASGVEEGVDRGDPPG